MTNYDINEVSPRRLKLEADLWRNTQDRLPHALTDKANGFALSLPESMRGKRYRDLRQSEKDLLDYVNHIVHCVNMHDELVKQIAFYEECEISVVRVYDHITNGRLSKINTDPEYIINAFDEATGINDDLAKALGEVLDNTWALEVKCDNEKWNLIWDNAVSVLARAKGGQTSDP